MPPVFRRLADLRAHLESWRGDGASAIALVPTMGALHTGHLALVSHALEAGRRAVVSIFVNPTQFGPNEDLATYPRQEEKDLAALTALGADQRLAVWAPAVDEMYPAGFATTVAVGGITDQLCGPFRPGHFAGVATIVTKLLQQVQPDIALFGEKDWQQLQVIRRFSRDLDIPVVIQGVAIQREVDDLARSSRNAYLSAAERAIAAKLPQLLRQTAKDAAQGHAPFRDLLDGMRRQLDALGYGPIDYLTIADAETLEPVETLTRPARIFVAAYLGRTRLIDNMPIPPEP